MSGWKIVVLPSNSMALGGCPASASNPCVAVCCSVLQWDVVCCSELQCDVMLCIVLQCSEWMSSFCARWLRLLLTSVLQWAAVSCSELHCVAVTCSELHWVAVCFSESAAASAGYLWQYRNIGSRRGGRRWCVSCSVMQCVEECCSCCCSVCLSFVRGDCSY